MNSIDVNSSVILCVACNLAFVGAEADAHRVFPDAHAHVSVEQEALPTEHLLLFDALLVGQSGANAISEVFIECHRSILAHDCG
jgi:hypothetical protein